MTPDLFDAAAGGAAPAQTPDGLESVRQVLAAYGWHVSDTGHFITRQGKIIFDLKIRHSRSRWQVIAPDRSNKVMFSGSTPQDIGFFIERFWYAEKTR